MNGPQALSDAAHAPAVPLFVGRADERTVLLERKTLAWAGRGQAVLLSGEAGIGKSRLIAWLVEQVAAEPCEVLSFHCAQHGIDSPAHPFVSGMIALAGIEPDDLASVKLDKLEALLAARASEMLVQAPVLAEALSIATGKRYAASDASPTDRRRSMLDALLTIATTNPRGDPVLLIVDDVHWADATSLELLGRLLRRIQAMPVLLLIASRPGFTLRVPHSGNFSTLLLERLDQHRVRAMIVQMTRETPLPTDVIDSIVAKADGIPLFAEELTRTMLGSVGASAALVRNDVAVRFATLAIPETLQESLMAQLDRLTTAKGVIQIGAAIGRDFRLELIALVSDLGDAEILTALDRLERAELVLRRGTMRSAVYTFKHALVRDAAYSSLTTERRKEVHRAIAEAIVTALPAIAAAEPETVARHFTEAGLADQAADWWNKAGESALRRSAYEEARAHLQRAVALYAARDGAPDLHAQLRLQVSLGQALLSARGFAAQETVAVFERAHDLAASIEDPRARFGTYYGLWMGATTAGTGASARKWAQAFLDDALMQAPLPEVGIGHRIVGNTLFFAGDFMEAQHHLRNALALCENDPELKIAYRYNVEQRAAAKVNLAMVLAPLGQRSEGLRLANEAVADALASKHFPTIAFVMGHRFTFDAICGDLASAVAIVREMQALASTYRIPIWQAWVDLFSGWLRFQLGEHGAGVTQMRAALAVFQGQGVGRFVPFCETTFALARALDDPDEGLAYIDDTMARFAESGEHWFDAELHRCRAKILLERSMPDRDAARGALIVALNIARVQGAQMFKLRAALDVAAFDREEGNAMLSATMMEPLDEMLEEVIRAKALIAASATV